MGHFYQLVAKTQYPDLDKGTFDHPPDTDPEQSIDTTLVTRSGMTAQATQPLQRLPFVAAPAR